MKSLYLVLIVSTLSFSYAYGQSCDSPPSTTNCSFYSDCLEDRYHCQDTKYRYPIEYGDRFCRAFDDMKYTLTERAQTWVDQTMTCLQRNLYYNFLVDDVLSDSYNNSLCRKISDTAFSSHHECYVRPNGNYRDGICPLWKDYVKIFKTGRPWEAIGTRYSSAVRKQVKKTARTCIAYWLRIKREKSSPRQIPIDSIVQQLEGYAL